MKELSWQMEKIIEVANGLQLHGGSAASTSEIIAGAFVLNRMDLLPSGYSDVLDAWHRLGNEWQGYVMLIKGHYRHLIREAPTV